MRLRWAALPNRNYRSQVVSCDREALVRVVDAVLQLHPGWDWPPEETSWIPGPTLQDFASSIIDLDQILTDASSVYEIDVENHRLTQRVDDTVRKAAIQAVKDTSTTPAEHLRAAWAAAYGVDPDPDKVFNEAIRAVEEVACPLVEQKKTKSGQATLGTVLGELRGNAFHKWELILPGKDGQPRDVAHLIGMMELLWEAQVSRHGGAPKSRRQDQAEAEAAVHVAATLVQWLSKGVLRHK